MERYVRWTRADGLPFDAWLRVHVRLGGELLRVAPRSMVIPGTVADWEEWTGMRFPESGPYIVPGALQPVLIDCEADTGLYEGSRTSGYATGSRRRCNVGPHALRTRSADA